MAEWACRRRRPAGPVHAWLIHLTDMTSSRTPPSPPSSSSSSCPPHTPMHRRGVSVLLRPHAPGVWSLEFCILKLETRSGGSSMFTHRVFNPLPDTASFTATRRWGQRLRTHPRCPSSHGSTLTTWRNNRRRKLLYGRQTFIIHLLWRVNLTYEEAFPSSVIGDRPLMQPRWEINESIAWYIRNDSAKKNQKYLYMNIICCGRKVYTKNTIYSW